MTIQRTVDILQHLLDNDLATPQRGKYIACWTKQALANAINLLTERSAITHCKECKFYNGGFCTLNWKDHSVNKMDYCCWGERRSV